MWVTWGKKVSYVWGLGKAGLSKDKSFGAGPGIKTRDTGVNTGWQTILSNINAQGSSPADEQNKHQAWPLKIKRHLGRKVELEWATHPSLHPGLRLQGKRHL